MARDASGSLSVENAESRAARDSEFHIVALAEVGPPASIGVANALGGVDE